MSLQLRRACVLGLLAAATALASGSPSKAQPSGAQWRSGNMIAVWTQASVSTQPPARVDCAIGALGKAVLFGGLAGGSAVNDTWEWSGTEWSQKTPAAQPPARSNHALATLGKNLVLYGGKSQSSAVLGDTWEWDGTNWASKSPSANPPARQGHAMSLFVGAKMTALLFGGLNGTGQRLGDTWSWDGTTWASSTPASSPSARADHAMATLGPKVVLFGGEDATGYLNDTWEWDGTNWSKKEPAASPPARARHAMGTWASRVVLFGGQGTAGTLNDTWEWDGANWAVMDATPSPSKRAQHAMATHTSGVILFGGVATADTWSYHSGLDNGSACKATGDCAFGHCVDLICCDSACEGQCESCGLAGKLGTCTAVTGDPPADRPACAGGQSCTTECEAGDTCVTTCDAGTDPCRGTCNGTNRQECTYPLDASVCVQPSCGNGQETHAATCSGSGFCPAPATVSCGEYACAGLTCKTSCTTVADCLPGRECKGSECIAVKPEAGVVDDSGTAGSGGQDASVTSEPPPEESSKGCGCTTPGRSNDGPPAGALLLIAAAAVLVRKRG